LLKERRKKKVVKKWCVWIHLERPIEKETMHWDTRLSHKLWGKSNTKLLIPNHLVLRQRWNGALTSKLNYKVLLIILCND
jgi:hypothetical protein